MLLSILTAECSNKNWYSTIPESRWTSFIANCSLCFSATQSTSEAGCLWWWNCYNKSWWIIRSIPCLRSRKPLENKDECFSHQHPEMREYRKRNREIRFSNRIRGKCTQEFRYLCIHKSRTDGDDKKTSYWSASNQKCWMESELWVQIMEHSKGKKNLLTVAMG